MYFKFACEHCGKNLKVREENAGRKVSCPYCAKSILVPQPPSSVDETVAENRPGVPKIQTRVSSTSGEQKKRDKSTRPAQWSNGTEVGMLLSGLIGLGIAVLFYLCLWPFKSTTFGEKFYDREWVPYVLTLLMGWSLAMLILKWRKLNRQRATMLFDIIPTDLGDDITIDNVDQFVRYVDKLPADPGSSFLINRVKRGLEHFRVRKNSSEVAAMLNSQSEIDAASVHSSYTMLKVFIWAIPILGFIGTVMGISAAVGGFAGSLEESQELAEIKKSLQGVTGGLGTAFDTTLVALIMSILVMFPTSSMQKLEEDLLNWVDEYCNENLLKRLNDKREGGSERASGAAGAATPSADLTEWSRRLEALGDTLMRQVVQGWSEVNTQLQGDEKERMTSLVQMHAQVDEAVKHSTKHIEQYTGDLSRGLTALADVLEKLGHQQVIIQKVKPRWRWFSGRDRDNGDS